MYLCSCSLSTPKDGSSNLMNRLSCAAPVPLCIASIHSRSAPRSPMSSGTTLFISTSWYQASGRGLGFGWTAHSSVRKASMAGWWGSSAGSSKLGISAYTCLSCLRASSICHAGTVLLMGMQQLDVIRSKPFEGASASAAQIMPMDEPVKTQTTWGGLLVMRPLKNLLADHMLSLSRGARPVCSGPADRSNKNRLWISSTSMK
mmetsp:Transcript_21659/g.55148  ORF Transcript_21659/g.55148 Transcript_21659/m.55148 type:complete len:203 (-) Transcript_21659:109-717(-)